MFFKIKNVFKNKFLFKHKIAEKRVTRMHSKAKQNDSEGEQKRQTFFHKINLPAF